MAKSGASKKRPVEQYEHKGKTRPNNPPVGLVDAKSDAVERKKSYAYDPHLDPTLSLPFAPGNYGRVAVKIVDDRGIESLKILEIQ